MISRPGRIFTSAPPCPFCLQEELKPYTTWQIGGPADILCRPATCRELYTTVRWAKDNHLPVTILGGGSNVLVADDGVEGVVILTRDINLLQIVPTSLPSSWQNVFAAAGASMDHLCQWAAERGLQGVTRFGGLPGSVGGALFMNARCHELSVSDLVETIYYLDSAGNLISLPAQSARYAYKDSIFQQEGLTVLGALFRLEKNLCISSLIEETERWKQTRVDSGQFLFPNAGCVFKNDYTVGIPAGKLIDNSGLRGHRNRSAAVYERHANFIVNLGTATARDVYELIRHVEQTVFQKTGVTLQREVRLIGRWTLPHPQ